MRQTEPNHCVQSLSVRVRHIHEGLPATTEMTVHCPNRGSCIAIEECVGCEHWGGLFLDPQERTSFLTCGGAPSREALRTKDEPAFQSCSYPPLGHTPIAEIMTHSVECVRPDLGLPALVALLLERHISSAPVVGDDGKPLGVVSKTDLLRAVEESGGKGLEGRIVADVMTPLVLALPETAPLSKAAWMMAYEGVHRIFVLSEDKKVVGLLAAMDIMRWLADETL